MKRFLTSSSALVSAAVLAGSIAGCSHDTRPTTPAAVAEQKAEISSRIEDATEVLGAVGGPATARTIPADVAAAARCVGVVPSLVQGGVLVGAKHGRGVVTCRVGEGWSSPGFFDIDGGTAGLQVGVQSVDVVLLVMSERAKRELLAQELRLGGDVSATAGPVGRGRAADTGTDLKSEMLWYSQSRGLFVGVELGGATIAHDAFAAESFYGHPVAMAELFAQPFAAPAPADAFIARVRELFPSAGG